MRAASGTRHVAGAEQMDKQEAETAHSCPPWARDKIPGLPASVVAVWVCTRRIRADFAAARYNAVWQVDVRAPPPFEIHVSRCERIM